MSEKTSDLAVADSGEVQEVALRKGIHELMSNCTEAQISGLHRIHDNAPWKGLANCPADKLAETYELLRRTVQGNYNKAAMGAQP